MSNKCAKGKTKVISKLVIYCRDSGTGTYFMSYFNFQGQSSKGEECQMCKGEFTDKVKYICKKKCVLRYKNVHYRKQKCTVGCQEDMHTSLMWLTKNNNSRGSTTFNMK